MRCSPVWMAHSLNRLASFSISQPCLAACFQGMENIVLACENTNGNIEYNFSEDSSARLIDRAEARGALTWSTHFRPSMVSELIILSSHGLILNLDTGMFAWEFRKGGFRRRAAAQEKHLYRTSVRGGGWGSRVHGRGTRTAVVRLGARQFKNYSNNTKLGFVFFDFFPP